MNNYALAVIVLDGLIAGMESNSSIPVQISELKMVKMLLTSTKQDITPIGK